MFISLPVTPALRWLACAATVLAVAACSPAFNWREVRPDNTRLSLLLPCKPDKAEKTVPLGGRPTSLAMLGCTTGGATFAVAVADLGDAARAADVLAQWQALTLTNMKAAPVGTGEGASQALPLKLPHAEGTPLPLYPVLVTARGQHPDGRPVEGWAAYFAQGSQVFQVVLYADKPQPGLADTYFSSLKLE